VAGFFGWFVDYVIMILADVLLSFPYFLLVVVISAVLGPSLTTAMIAIGIWTAPYYTRVIRANTLELKSWPFVEAAVVTGESRWGTLLRHILPNCLSQVLVLSTTYMSQAILMASALSFLGLGAQPPKPEWGAMTAIGREYIFQAPHLLTVPAVAILLTALAFNFLGDALRDVLDPRMRGL
jgi:ABC-type dipeptide/oligopeptide/nickel transport system permease subunit